MEERAGGAVEDGVALTVVGRVLEPGEPAPAFTLDHFDGTTLRPVSLKDLAGSTVVLNVVNSVDTPVCDVQTRRVDSLFPGAKVLTVSMDLPFALARWTEAAGVNHPALSSHRREDFGRDYGVLIKEWRALQRSLFVIDGDGRLVHAQYVTDQNEEPDYDAAIVAAGGRPAAGGGLDALAAQLQTAWFMLWGRLEGLADEEYLWEPVPGAWSVRPAADGRGRRDWATPPPDPLPVPTIAWRMCTLAATQTLRLDWTFGEHRLQWDDLDLPWTVAGAMTFLERATVTWIHSVTGLTDADLARPLCNWPGGPLGRPFGETLWWTNRELIAAGAEIGLLRDLYRAGPG